MTETVRTHAINLKVGDYVITPGINPNGKIVQMDELFTRTPGGAARFATLETDSGEHVPFKFSHCIKYGVVSSVDESTGEG